MPTQRLLNPLPPIPWGTRFEYTRPANFNDTGQAQVQAAVEASFRVGPLPPDWDWAWEVPQGAGPYTGKLPSRVKTWLWKEKGVKATKGVVNELSKLGELAQRVCPKTDLFHFDVTQELDWRAGLFADGDSCFFSWKKHINGYVVKAGNGCLRRWTKTGQAYHPAGRCYVLQTAYGYALSNQRDVSLGYDQRAELMARALGHLLGLAHVDRCGAMLYNYEGEDRYVTHGWYSDGPCWMLAASAGALAAAQQERKIYTYMPTREDGPVHVWQEA